MMEVRGMFIVSVILYCNVICSKLCCDNVIDLKQFCLFCLPWHTKFSQSVKYQPPLGIPNFVYIFMLEEDGGHVAPLSGLRAVLPFFYILLASCDLTRGILENVSAQLIRISILVNHIHCHVYK